MKNLLLIFAMLFTLSSCQDKESVIANVNFEVATNGTQAELNQIVGLLQSKGLPVGKNIQVTVEGTTDITKMDEEIKRIVSEMLIRFKPEDFKAICKTGSYARYFGAYSMLPERAIGTAVMEW